MGGKRLGGYTAGTAYLSWPKGYSTPNNVVLSNKNGEVLVFKVVIAQRLAGH